MLVAAFKSLSAQLLVITGILAVCAVVTWAVDGRQSAIAFLETAIVKMKGPWVWTFGFGLASFIAYRGRFLPASIGGVVVADEVIRGCNGADRAVHIPPNALRYTLPTTALGIFLTYFYGVPNKGISYYLVFGAVCSIYYVAAFLLFHFVEVTGAFHDLFESMDSVDFKTIYDPLHLENLTTYLALTTTLGLIAVYAGFRGTLTAGFVFKHQVWRSFLSTPLVLFLPATLFYNYYPRYVLRRVVQHKVFEAMERLGDADEQSAKLLLHDLKECSFVNSQILPFLDYKSIPSYLIAVCFAISLAYNNDPAVQRFMRDLFGAAHGRRFWVQRAESPSRCFCPGRFPCKTAIQRNLQRFRGRKLYSANSRSFTIWSGNSFSSSTSRRN